MPIWHVVNFVMVFFFIFSVLHLLSLRNFPKRQVAEEAVIYVLYSGLSLLAIITCHTIERDPSYAAEITTEVLWAGGIRYKGAPSLMRIPQFVEMFGYGSVAALHCTPIISAVFPIVRNYDPFSIFLKDILGLTEQPRRVLASAAFGLFALGGVIGVCCEILLMASSMLVFGILLKQLENLNQNESYQLDQERVDWFQKLMMKLLKKLPVRNRVWNTNKVEHKLTNCPMWFDNSIVAQVFRTYRNKRNREINQKFREQLHVHNQLYIIMTSCNYCARLFFPVLAFLGISLSIAMNYAVIMLSEEMELYLYLFACFIDTVCFGLIYFYCYHGAMPLVLSTRLIEFWKGKQMGKAEMKSARAMLPVACMLGHFFSAKKHTFLDIMSNILDYTVSFIVL
ncbi:unnamed protein product [Orchesella dallaii]|uniref:Odorant receptor n=1 Tax=Orchesella dallaii TaxID=48710 RepID=A0ABP1RUP6_9HEXA